MGLKEMHYHIYALAPVGMKLSWALTFQGVKGQVKKMAPAGVVLFEHNISSCCFFLQFVTCYVFMDITLKVEQKSDKL